jgi:hypothetical protein
LNSKLALFTFGVFAKPADDPANDGFHLRNDPILAAVPLAQGYLGHSGYPDEEGPEIWGEYVCPDFHVEAGDGWTPQTLSLWQNLESTMAFAYQGLHGEAVRHGREWFVAPQWPPYALWWVDADHTPDWREACAKHLQLHEQGNSRQVFSFKQPFGADGKPVKLNAGRIKQLAAANAARLANITRAG